MLCYIIVTVCPYIKDTGDHISLCSNAAKGREFLRGCLGGIFLLMTPSGPALLLLLLWLDFRKMSEELMGTVSWG